MALNKTQEELAAWMLTSKRDRRVHGLPNTFKEWAEWKGVTDRTVRRWRDSDEFKTHLEHRRIANTREMTNFSTVTADELGGAKLPKDARLRRRAESGATRPASAADDPLARGELTDDEAAYEKARDTLIRMAEEGSTDALRLYYQHYGQRHIEAENAAASDLAHLDDEQLALELVRVIGPDMVAMALAEQAAA